MKQSLLRVTILVLLVAMNTMRVAAQEVEDDYIPPTTEMDVNDSIDDNAQPNQDSIGEPLPKPRLKLGLRGGINMPNMIYSHEPVSRYEHEWQYVYMLGVFAEMPIGKTPLSLRPEVTILSRGVRLNWLDVDYDFMARYIDLRLPITFNFNWPSEKISPYLMVVPQFNMPFNGKIKYKAEDYPNTVSADITEADISKYDVSVMFGAGIDFRIDFDKFPIFLSVEGGYNMGLLNNFAPREMIDATENPSVITNPFLGAELWHEKRHTRGVEVAMRLSVPLDADYLAEYRKRRDKKPDVVVLEKVDTLPVEVEKFVEKEIMTEPRSKTTVYQTKECFSISELYNLIDQGIDITGKRICMFDINFDFDSYKIRKESERPINELVQMMLDYPHMTVEVYGHTDSIGTDEYNQRLSENRAKAVLDYISNHGVSPSRVRSYGYGEKYPIDDNSTEVGRFRNRRVEFDVITIGEKRKYR